MARTPKIRLTKNDRKEYARLVKNAKAKINRTIKEKGSQVVVEQVTEKGETVYTTMDIRDMVSIPSLNEITDRKSFNQFKQQLSSFTNRFNRHFQFLKNEFGVVSTAATVNAIEKNNKKAIKHAEQRQKELFQHPLIQKSEVVGSMADRWGFGRKYNAGVSIPADFDFGKMQNTKRLIDKAFNNLEKADKNFFNKRDRNFKEKFIQGIELAFNTGEADAIVEMLKNMPDEDFYIMYQTHDEFDIDVYDPSPQQEFRDGQYIDEGMATRNLRYIDRYLREYYDGKGGTEYLLKGF